MLATDGARNKMTVNSPVRKPMRMALLLNWRSKGYFRPHYGLVDDEELLRTGISTFLSTDGRHLPATSHELLLLQEATPDTPVASAGVVASAT